MLLERRPAEQADFMCASYRQRLREGLRRRGLEADVVVRLRPWSDAVAGELPLRQRVS